MIKSSHIILHLVTSLLLSGCIIFPSVNEVTESPIAQIDPGRSFDCITIVATKGKTRAFDKEFQKLIENEIERTNLKKCTNSDNMQLKIDVNTQLTHAYEPMWVLNAFILFVFPILTQEGYKQTVKYYINDVIVSERYIRWVDDVGINILFTPFSKKYFFEKRKDLFKERAGRVLTLIPLDFKPPAVVN